MKIRVIRARLFFQKTSITMNVKNATVLIIDDDTDVLTAVKMLLKTEVKEVVTEKNPENIRHLFSKKYHYQYGHRGFP